MNGYGMVACAKRTFCKLAMSANAKLGSRRFIRSPRSGGRLLRTRRDRTARPVSIKRTSRIPKDNLFGQIEKARKLAAMWRRPG
jgi:hypothetical protein